MTTLLHYVILTELVQLCDMPFSPDGGDTYIHAQWTLVRQPLSTMLAFSSKTGRLQHHSTFNLNVSPNRDHPLVVRYPSAKEHFLELVIAVLKVSDCCHGEPNLLLRIVQLLQCGWETTDFHKAVCAAGILIGDTTISGFPLQAALGALLLSPAQVNQMIACTDEGFVKEEHRKSWTRRTQHFNIR